MRSVIIIPARYQSSRFPGKPLALLLNKPMILWVAELSEKAVGRDNVYIATDSEDISKVVRSAGFNVVLTSKECLTGTDRLSEAAEKITSDIYINVQGDEPLVDPRDIISIIKAKELHRNNIINGYCSISDNENPNNINIPKVVFTEDKKLIYMSRSLIPGAKNQKPARYYKQVCIYAFTLSELQSFSNFGRKSSLEQFEDIEIIRFLEWGKTIRMVETRSNSLAVDTKEDVVRVELELKKVHNV